MDRYGLVKIKNEIFEQASKLKDIKQTLGKTETKRGYCKSRQHERSDAPMSYIYQAETNQGIAENK